MLLKRPLAQDIQLGSPFLVHISPRRGWGLGTRLLPPPPPPPPTHTHTHTCVPFSSRFPPFLLPLHPLSPLSFLALPLPSTFHILSHSVASEIHLFLIPSLSFFLFLSLSSLFTRSLYPIYHFFLCVITPISHSLPPFPSAFSYYKMFLEVDPRSISRCLYARLSNSPTLC